jgi:hypothetical protein
LDTTLVIAVGVICGLAGALPPAYLFEVALKNGASKAAGTASVANGLLSILVSFAMLSLATFVVYFAARESTLAFGCAMITAFLAVWGVESIRGWRAANGRASAEGKDE